MWIAWIMTEIPRTQGFLEDDVSPEQDSTWRKERPAFILNTGHPVITAPRWNARGHNPCRTLGLDADLDGLKEHENAYKRRGVSYHSPHHGTITELLMPTNSSWIKWCRATGVGWWPIKRDSLIPHQSFPTFILKMQACTAQDQWGYSEGFL